MQTTNSFYYKFPDKNFYSAAVSRRETPLSKQEAQCAAAKSRNANLIVKHTADEATQKKNQANWEQITKDRMKTRYCGTFNKDMSSNIAIDEILRSTLNKPFQTEHSPRGSVLAKKYSSCPSENENVS